LILAGEFTTRTAARERKKYFKGGFVKEFLKRMI
jgi:hypothetical protein